MSSHQSSPEAPRTTYAPETSASEGGNYTRNFASTFVIRGGSRFFYMPQGLGHGTDSFTSPPKEGMRRIFPRRATQRRIMKTQQNGHRKPASINLSHCVPVNALPECVSHIPHDDVEGLGSEGRHYKPASTHELKEMVGWSHPLPLLRNYQHRTGSCYTFLYCP